MTISAQIILDSENEHGKRITTLQLRYPRFIHSEFMTHRVFSRNASSSRAIPVERLIEDIIQDTAMPMHWGKNQPGMQANEECDANVMIMHHHLGIQHGMTMASRVGAWLKARDKAIEVARAFNDAGYHKQIVNRLLEPFSHINVVVTATEWDNFFELRDHPDAQPEIRVLAQEIRAAMEMSNPQFLNYGEWHLPYADANDDIKIALKVSVARCARVSYFTLEKGSLERSTLENDIKLYDRLIVQKPAHASPCEHQACSDRMVDHFIWADPMAHGNFIGWKQNRKLLGL